MGKRDLVLPLFQKVRRKREREREREREMILVPAERPAGSHQV
jgi:hypothetical protein